MAGGIFIGRGLLVEDSGGSAEGGVEDERVGNDEEFSVDLLPDLDGEAEERERHCPVRGCLGFGVSLLALRGSLPNCEHRVDHMYSPVRGSRRRHGRAGVSNI